MNRYKEALADLNGALKINSSNVMALESRGETYYKINRYEKACEDLSQLLEIDPDNKHASEILKELVTST